MNGEFEFIGAIKSLFESVKSGKYEGIGDDCAVIPIGDDKSLVVTSDMLVEGVHFLRDIISPNELGHKSLAVNLSDVAAMGARPIATFMSVAIPSNLGDDYLAGFLEGYHALSQLHNVELLGGDTTSSNSDFVINVTAIGIVDNNSIARRSSARVGDFVVANSALGCSGAGLKLILENKFDAQNINHNYLLAAHHLPQPQVNQGIWLARNGVSAMMDISDGVASDIGHICNSSGVGADIFVDRIPLDNKMVEVCSEQGWSVVNTALSSGEDYLLLFCVDPLEFGALEAKYEEEFGSTLHKIGIVTDSNIIRFLDGNMNECEIPMGFTHF